MKKIILFTFGFVISVIHGENYCDTGLHAPENSTDPDICCPSPVFLPMEIVKECRDTYLDMQKKKNDIPGLPRGCCIGDCILDRMGLNPNGDGNIDFDGLRTFLLEQTKEEPAWTDTVTQAIYDCYEMAEARAEDFKTGYTMTQSFEGEKMCHPISGRVLSCITNQKFINCPTNIWKGTDDCESIKTYVQRCEETK